MINIEVRYFASLRERMGRANERLSVDPGTPVAEVWARVSQHRQVPDKVLAAVNQEYASFESALADGDELAFFPPVTGG